MSRAMVVVIIVLSVAAVSVCGVVIGRLFYNFGRESCPDAEEVMAQELARSPVLGLTPPNASDIEKYMVKPCEDDDKTGSVGVNFSFSGSKDVLLDYYKAELPSYGWVLRGDGSSRLCFENPTKHGVALKVFTASAQAPNSLEFRFNSQGVSCGR